jgi:signal transduction histidine kinase
VHDVTQPPWRDIYVEFWPGTRSELAVPLLINERCIGVLNFEHPEPGYFSEDEREIIEDMATQAATAIHNAALYDAIKRRSQHLQALHEASKAIAAGFAAKRKQTLDRIAEQAVERITGIKGPKATRGAIMLYDEVANELQLESVYPPEALPEFQSRVGESRSLLKDKAPNGKIGITGRTVLEGKPQRVNDVRIDIDYIESSASTRSKLAVPLLDGDKIIGVLSVESDHRGSFDEDAAQVLQALADLAVIAIRNATQYEALKELDRRKTEFLSTVSHELRTPLTPVKSCIENLLSGMYGPLTDKQQTRLEIALTSTREEARLIENLLDLVRIQEDRVTLELEWGSVAAIIHNVINVFEYDADQKKITLIEELPDADSLETLMDVGKVKQVVTNLVSNAFKFTPEGGTITIVASKRDHQVEVRVQDTGIGIPQEEFKNIFDRFYQVDSSSTRKVSGTGIGLNIVKEYVEMHGGHIWVESKVGKGSTFSFTLPAHSSEKD